MANSSLNNWRASPVLVRTVPFIIFVVLTAGQGQFGEASRYWVYLLKTIVGAGLVWSVWPYIPEMRWRVSAEAVLAGVLVFGLWVGLDGLYLPLETLLKKLLCPVLSHVGLQSWCAIPVSPAHPWNPVEQFGPSLGWGIAAVRVVGTALIVPPLEEVFYRSFLYRYLAKPEFDTLPLNHFHWGPFLITSAIFGFAHYEWLPGVLCGMIYLALVIRHNRLGDAMVAHAITNLLLGLWVIWKGAWHFW